MVMVTHYFDSTGEAYDACQCDPEIEVGDVLIVRSEHVVGVAHTWPLAITKEHGAFHAPKEGVTVGDVITDPLFKRLTIDHLLHGLHAAQARNWPWNRVEPS